MWHSTISSTSRTALLEALEHVLGGVIERDFGERQHALPEAFRVQVRVVAVDESLPFQAPDALDTGRQREIHGACELRDGQPPVRLQ